MSEKDNSHICPFCNKNYNSCASFFEKHLSLCLKNPSNNYSENPVYFEPNKHYLPNQKIKFKCSKCGKERVSYFRSLDKDFVCAPCKSAIGFKKIKNQIDWKERNLKTKQTLIAKYGSFEEATNQRLKKAKQTCLKKYGVENIFYSKEIQEQLRQKLKEKGGVGNANPSTKQKALHTWLSKDPEFRKQSLSLKKNWKNKTKEEINQRTKKIKKTCIERYGVESPLQLENTQTNRRKKYFYDNLYFDSKPELAFYICCKNQNLNIKRCTKSFSYNFKGKKYFYFPDFEIEGVYYEIKGDQFLNKEGKWYNPFDRSQDEKYEAKHQCALKNNVTILYTKDYQKYLKEAKKIEAYTKFLREFEEKKQKDYSNSSG